MIRLTTLGSIDLTAADGARVEAVLRQPKRLLLLCYLAIARAPVSRDLLLAAFWPEAAEINARRSLATALNFLRSSLGANVIVSDDGAGLRIDRDLLWCDAVAFEEALDRGDEAGALAVYGDGFLPGLFGSGSHELDEWLDSQRRRLRRRAAGAAYELALAARRENRPLEAIEWSRRCAELALPEPALFERALAILAELGDRPGVLEAYHALKRRLGDDQEPAPGIRQLVESMPVRTAAHPVPDVESGSGRRAPAVRGGAVTATAPLAGRGPARPPAADSPSRWTLRRSAAVAAVALGLLAWFAMPGRLDPHSEDAPGRPVVRIDEFRQIAIPPELGDIGSALTGAVLARLAGVQGIYVATGEPDLSEEADPARSGSSAGPVFVLRGEVIGSGSTVRVNVGLLGAASGIAVGSTSIEAPTGETLALVDHVAREAEDFVRMAVGRELRERRHRTAGVDALAIRMVSEAESIRREARSLAEVNPGRAIAALARADSLLALAEQRASGWSEPSVLRAEVALTRLMRSFFSPGADAAPAAEILESGIRHAEQALDVAPRDAAALEIRGVLRHWQWLLADDPDRATLAAAGSDLQHAVELDPGRSRAWGRLSAIHAAAGRFAEAYWAAEKAYAADSYIQNPGDLLMRLFDAALEIGEDGKAARWCSEFGRRFPDHWAVLHCRLSLAAWGGDGPPAPPEARRLVEATLDAAPAEPAVHASLEMRAAAVLARAGLHQDAESLIGRARARAPNDAELSHYEAAARLHLGQTDSAAAILTRHILENPVRRTGLLARRRFDTIRETVAASIAWSPEDRP